TMVLDNTDAAGGNNTNRIPDGVRFNADGGSFIFKGSESADSTETVGRFIQNTASGGVAGIPSPPPVVSVIAGAGHSAILTAGTGGNHSFSADPRYQAYLVNGVGLGANTTAANQLVSSTSGPDNTVGSVDPLSTGINAGVFNTRMSPSLVGESAVASGGLGTLTGVANT